MPERPSLPQTGIDLARCKHFYALNQRSHCMCASSSCHKNPSLCTFLYTQRFTGVLEPYTCNSLQYVDGYTFSPAVLKLDSGFGRTTVSGLQHTHYHKQHCTSVSVPRTCLF